MKPRKTKEIESVLVRKGFKMEFTHHRCYIFYIGKEKQNIRTYLSHGVKEYGKGLMDSIKKQLKFKTNDEAENFFDCPMTYENYLEMLRVNGNID